jgi:hypothetical protein
LLVSEIMTTLLAFTVGWSLLHLPPALMAEYRKSGKRQTHQRPVNLVFNPRLDTCNPVIILKFTAPPAHPASTNFMAHPL